MKSRAWTIAILALFVGCTDPAVERPAPPAPVKDELASALNQLAGGEFEILDLTPRGGNVVTLVDALRYHTRVFAQPFSVRLRLLRPLTVPTLTGLAVETRKVGWNEDRILRQVALRVLLGEGTFEPGATRTAEATAVFDESEKGWRYRILSGEHFPPGGEMRL